MAFYVGVGVRPEKAVYPQFAKQARIDQPRFLANLTEQRLLECFAFIDPPPGTRKSMAGSPTKECTRSLDVAPGAL